MITLHHLERSRSHRILWLLEELGLDYKIEIYQRDPKTTLAPQALKAIHPLGKSPVITDGDVVVAESSAIIEYLMDTYAGEQLRPAKDSTAYNDYRYFIHAAEGSFMPYLFLAYVMERLSQAPVPFLIRPIAKALEVGLRKQLINPNIKAQHLFIDETLSSRDWLCGHQFTAADIQMSYPLIAADSRSDLSNYPSIGRFIERLKQRSAYQRALKKGGPMELT